MIPGAKLRVTPKPMFHELWREMIVLFEMCFEVVLVKSGLILNRSSKIRSLMGASIEYPFRTKQKISHHNPSVPPCLRGAIHQRGGFVL
jgi:hypothetical protein